MAEAFLIDERPILDGFPLIAKFVFDTTPGSVLSYMSSTPVQIWIEDLDVRMLDKNDVELAQGDTGPLIKPLIWEGFNNYEIGKFPSGAGWIIGQKAISEDSIPSKANRTDKQGLYIDGREFLSSPRSLKLDSSEWPVQTEKRISLPDKAPFGVSEGTFAIVVGTGDTEGKPDEEATQESSKNQGKPTGEREYVTRNRQLLKESSQERVTTRLKADDRARDSAGSGEDNSVKILSASPAGSFYIYSYDGKLMAEYDTSGQWVRDYIYVGNQLIAEYTGGTYYYYASDQINSTRVVTNNSGVVVYSAAYDPYGGIQKTWVSTYAPTMKFSGKERDVESGLDYFGARYYANYYYRWLSPDPMINHDAAMTNPQVWNLYSFCRNNPVTYWDPDGNVELAPIFNLNYLSSHEIYKDFGSHGGAFIPGLSIDIDVREREKGIWSPLVTIIFSMNIYIPKPGDYIYGWPGYPKNPEESKAHEYGHAMLGFSQLIKLYAAAEQYETLRFSSEAAARKAAAAGKLLLTAYNFQLGIENQLANKAYDFLGIRMIKPGSSQYKFLDAIFK